MAAISRLGPGRRGHRRDGGGRRLHGLPHQALLGGDGPGGLALRGAAPRRLAENDLKPWRKEMWCTANIDAKYVAPSRSRHRQPVHLPRRALSPAQGESHRAAHGRRLRPLHPRGPWRIRCALERVFAMLTARHECAETRSSPFPRVLQFVQGG
jgi:hypothetical protein